MYISNCLIYEKVQFSIRMDGNAVYLAFDCPSKQTYVNMTFDREQTRLIADTLIGKPVKGRQGES